MADANDTGPVMPGAGQAGQAAGASAHPHSPLPEDSPFAPTLRGPQAAPPKDDLLAALEWDAPLSLAHQDLTADRLIREAPRMQAGRFALPTLGGIPLLAKLGQGGMGAVYYGLHLRLRREVAVKVLPFHLVMQQPDLVKRFFREAQMAARVQSPHLVSVLDVNEDHGLHYLVMEYVHGLSGGAYLRLRQQQETRRGLPESEVLEIGLAVCTGLTAAHTQGVVHRDIKVDNILIPWADPGRRVDLRGAKLADLGLGRSEEAGHTLTGTQATLGTPGYMAPEQASDARRAGPPADVFSLGATLYALLSGQAPFVGSSAFEVLLATAQKPHAPLRELCPNISAATAGVIDRCLQKAPDRRYRDGAELLSALRECSRSAGPVEQQAFASTLIQPHQQAVPTPAAFRPGTPALSPVTPVSGTVPMPASSAPTQLAPVAQPRHIGRWVAVVLLLLLAAAAGVGWFWVRGQHERHLKAARTALQQRDWKAAKQECEETLRFSFLQDTLEVRDLLDRAVRGASYEEEIGSAHQHAQEGRWRAAEAAYTRALAVSGFENDQVASTGLAHTKRQLDYQENVTQAEARCAAQDWAGAKKAYEEALAVPGFATDTVALAGRLKAEQRLNFGEALSRAREAVAGCHWDEALDALQAAQAVPGFEQDPAANALRVQARNGAEFEQARTNAMNLLTARQFKRADEAFGSAAALAREPNSPISREALALVLNGKTFAALLGDAESSLQRERWSEAQTALKTAAALPNFEKHPVLVDMQGVAKRGIEFAYYIETGQRRLSTREWADAHTAFETAQKVAGFQDDARVIDGLDVSQRGLNFVKAVEEGKREARAGEWARAQAAYQRALALKGFEDEADAVAGLKDASVQLARLGKEKAYRSALAEAQRLRKAAPSGPRERDAWAAVRAAAQTAMDSGHPDVSEAEALRDEAVRAEKAAQGWLDSDQKLNEAKALAKQNDWNGAAAALKQALTLAPRTDTAEFQAQLASAQARAQGHSYWEGDRKYLDYKDRRWLIGIRGKPLDKDPFIGSACLKPGTGPTLFWVRVAEKEFYFIRDTGTDRGVGFQIIRNENTANAAKTERTEWVGPYAMKDGKWIIQIKMYRQYDKQNGGSGSMYPDATDSEMSVDANGNVVYKARLWKSLTLDRGSYEVSDEIAKRAVDAYLNKWPGQ